jgi:hypothetical protein
MAEVKTYVGGCHCGRVRYEVTADVSQVWECNCSFCSRRAHLLKFVMPDEFKLLSGEAGLTDYQFREHNRHHYFCSACGIGAFNKGVQPDGRLMIGVNVRCLDGVDVSNLTVAKFDGRSL